MTPDLRRNDRGAIMVIGLFMAILLVGSIYYLAGIAETLVVRERMQDAADTGAYTQASMHARGMNFIALSNVTMEAYTAVWIALEAVQELAGIGLDEAFDECDDPDDPDCCGSRYPLSRIETRANRRRRRFAGIAERVVETADEANKAVAVAMPGAATGRFMDLVEGAYAPQSGVSFTWPAYNRLPVAVMPISELCDAGRRPAKRVADRPFDRRHLCHEVDDEIDGEKGDSVRGAANRICSRLRGRARVAPPSFSHRIWRPDEARFRVRPRNPGRGPRLERRGRMKVQGGTEMGGEAFQVRVLIRGNRQGLERHARGLEAMALLGSERDEAGETYQRLRRLGRLTFAQAEFYFDGNADREQWLMKMDWESRLRRFRPPSEGASPQRACRQWGGGGHCRGINRIVTDLGTLAIH